MRKEKYFCDKSPKQLNFIYKPIIDYYITIDEFITAESWLKEIFDLEDEWHYRDYSRIYRGINKYALAKENIKKAIDIYNDKGEKFYLATFYNEYADILNDLKDIDCIEILKLAIDYTYDNKIIWKKKLEKWILIYNTDNLS